MLLRGFAFAFALISAVPAFSANLVVNGGFETGDFTGWTVGSSNSLFVDTASPHTGIYSAHLGNYGSLVALGQLLATTPGTTYNLSFYLENDSSGTPNEFKVTWNGNTVFDQVDMTAGPYALYSFNLTATGNSTDLEFLHRHDPDHFFLDDIAVQSLSSTVGIESVATPEPAAAGFVLLGLVAVVAIRQREALGKAPVPVRYAQFK